MNEGYHMKTVSAVAFLFLVAILGGAAGVAGIYLFDPGGRNGRIDQESPWALGIILGTLTGMIVAFAILLFLDRVPWGEREGRSHR